jgi:protein-export membrane protein SecD
MKQNWWYRFLFMCLVLVATLLSVSPTLFNTNSLPVKSKINLGLDLQGGLYIVLGIDFNKVYFDEVKTHAQRIVSFLESEQAIKSEVGEINKTVLSDPKVRITLAPMQLESAKSLIRKNFDYNLRLTGSGDNYLEYGVNNQRKIDVEKNAITKSIEVIRNRIDEFGVTEPEIVAQGNDRIVVQLPGVKDIDRAKELIGKTAKLAFKLVNEDVSDAEIQKLLAKSKEAGIEFKGQHFSDYLNKLNVFLKDDLPKGYELAFEKSVNKNTNEVTLVRALVVETNNELSGDDLQDARVLMNQEQNEPYVGIDFKSKAGKKFEELSGNNVGKRMAIILDGNIYSDPVFQQRIAGGSASITLGRGGYEELFKQSTDLALVLRAGALPVELEFQEQRIVGPSLGADSIANSKFAGILGCMAVFLFILFYYKVSGAIALFTLSLNILIVLGCLVGLEATLTLPGIAGIALTVGMAVDANIIIFERIKEEIEAGASARPAVEAGFAKAFWTIIDANLTTAVAGAALLNFGTGPIRGFAVTLLIGIFATIYCSYFVGKLLFEFYMERTQGKNISI